MICSYVYVHKHTAIFIDRLQRYVRNEWITSCQSQLAQDGYLQQTSYNYRYYLQWSYNFNMKHVQLLSCNY